MKDFLSDANFKYCVAFLKNGGEYVRAIKLVTSVCGLTIIGAREWIDGLNTKIPLCANEEPIISCVCGVDFHAGDKRIENGTCPICLAKLEKEEKE